MNYAVQLIVEGLTVGLMLAVLGTLVSLGVRCPIYGSIPSDAKYYISTALYLFISGFLFHVVFELLQVNKWWCQNGAVSKTLNS